ncbi:hypothetical protein F5B22DRAFT_175925 [Xylaria bambusicola]|uniref:uncharacterized protein n=1 Tax=Xylaria bambusicola TaxID=326684 RepID=UPI002007F9A7|nr:uncharacterized protein F5B22DRAFT_175925 [Xylaria bambusicola]KAI0516694.1 hypothetical protein F5B22DRAFT_175925 [Xylaria bambusicola]
MPKLVKSWPYAAASTGHYRGRLEGKLECWDANGPARAIFNDELHVKIKDHIVTNLPESTSFIGFSLFMVGRTQLRTSPTVLLVSDDKPRRKAAFEAIKSSGILEKYPGFHVAHCRLAAEFEDLKPMGGRKVMTRRHHHRAPRADCGIYVSSQCVDGPLLVHDHASGVLGGSQAAIGCLLSQGDHLYGVTVAHVLADYAASFKLDDMDHGRRSNSPDFETTAVDDDLDDDLDDECEPKVRSVTSEESKSLPGDGPDDEIPLSPGLLADMDNYSSSLTSDSQDEEEPLPTSHYDAPDTGKTQQPVQCNGPDDCIEVATIAHVSSNLDMTLLAIGADLKKKSFHGNTVDLSRFANTIESIDDDVGIYVRPLSSPWPVPGRLSATAFYAQYGTTGFQRFYLAKLSTPLRPGDCGSWAFPVSNGVPKMIGMVVAGSPSTGTVLIVPGQTVLDYIKKHVDVHKW